MILARLFKIRDRVEKHWNERDAIECYNQHPRDQVAFVRAYRAKAKTYGIDPMTILMLLQIAMRLYFWCKEQGFLDEAPTNVPTFAMLFEQSEDAQISASAMISLESLDDES